MELSDPLAVNLKLGAPLAALVVISGCFLARASRNTDDLQRVASLKGTVNGPSPGKPLFVVLFKHDGQRWIRFSHRLLYRPGPFEFSCLAGRYTLLAFEDLNEDLAWQAEEPAHRLGPTEGIAVAEGAALSGLDLTVTTEHGPLGLEISLAGGPTIAEELVRVHRGDRAQLEEERFGPAAGDLGLWQPVDFAFKWGVGVSFLDEYVPGKIPVLFIHGAAGSPSDFTSMIKRLDRSRFQPWVYSYPSGIRLALASMTLQRIVDDLQQRLKFEKLYVVAHSMGGLVAREFVTQVVANKPKNFVGLLLTIASPWGGVESAKFGVDRSPVVLPSWIDVAVGSPFLDALSKKALPADLPYYLFFAFEGGTGSDGTITLKSQLEPRAQQGAKQVQGFPEDHTSILSSAAVHEQLNAILAAP